MDSCFKMLRVCGTLDFFLSANTTSGGAAEPGVDKCVRSITSVEATRDKKGLGTVIMLGLWSCVRYEGVSPRRDSLSPPGEEVELFLKRGRLEKL